MHALFAFIEIDLLLAIKCKTKVKVNEAMVRRTDTLIYRYIHITWLYAYGSTKYLKTIAGRHRMLCNPLRLSLTFGLSCGGCRRKAMSGSFVQVSSFLSR